MNFARVRGFHMKASGSPFEWKLVRKKDYHPTYQSAKLAMIWFLLNFLQSSCLNLLI